MNEILKNLEIPGHETKVIIVPRNKKDSKANDGFQLALEIKTDSNN
ncbi:hypothetical protein I7V34_19950 [Bacillus sp. V3]|nr:hypothetical protein I7V34_19950 [Bacillus sp. V3]